MQNDFAKHKKKFADQVAKQRAKQPAKQGANSNVLPSQAKPSQAKPSLSLVRSETDVGPRGANSTNQYPGDFEQFWNAFPPRRRTKKKAAFAAWKRVLKDSSTTGCSGPKPSGRHNVEWRERHIARGAYKVLSAEASSAITGLPEHIRTAGDHVIPVESRHRYGVDPMR